VAVNFIGRKLEYTKKTTDLPQVTDKLDHSADKIFRKGTCFSLPNAILDYDDISTITSCIEITVCLSLGEIRVCLSLG
jgi:hypothetical protein